MLHSLWVDSCPSIVLYSLNSLFPLFLKIPGMLLLFFSEVIFYFSGYVITRTYGEPYAGLVADCFEGLQTWIHANDPLVEATAVHLSVGVAGSVAGPAVEGHLRTRGGG